jgi:hypothetical protein
MSDFHKLLIFKTALDALFGIDVTYGRRAFTAGFDTGFR